MSSEAMYNEARQLEKAGELGKAVAIYKKLIAESEDPRYHIALGVCLQRLAHWSESIRHLQHGIALKPHYCEGARLFLAESLLKVGRWKIVPLWVLTCPRNMYQWKC